MDIHRLIRAHGASRYLACLRARYQAGNYSRQAYAIRAASAYLADGKPLRAQMLLETVEPDSLSGRELDRFARILGLLRAHPPLDHPDCSLNMIVRDEAHNICAALDSVDTFFDELVICDTGSHDETVELAQLYGARIVHHQWNNDFSAARNAALRESRCAWVFWMDADDRLSPQSAQSLVKLWRDGQQRAFAIRVANHMPHNPPVEFLQVRLFPRDERIRFERRIHEQLMFSLRRAGITCARAERIRIEHMGYADSDTHRRKALRNQALIEEELRASPAEASLLLALADGYLTLGQKHQALSAYRNLCGTERAHIDNADAFIQAHVNVGMLEYGRGNLREAARYFYRSLYLDNKRIESWYYLGRIALKRGREREAASCFVRGAGPMPPLRMTAVNNTLVRLESLYSLSEILFTWGHFSEIEELLKSALVQYPYVPRFYTQIARACLACNRLTDAARAFTQSITLCPRRNDEAYIGMAQVYLMTGDRDCAMRYLGRALKNGGNAQRIRAAVESINSTPHAQCAPRAV